MVLMTREPLQPNINLLPITSYYIYHLLEQADESDLKIDKRLLARLSL
jgi:hypothetical protein